jgi:hypothetical protein
MVEKLAYSDEAVYYPPPSGTDEFGQPTAPTIGIPVSCSFTDKVSSETWSDTMNPELIEMELRVRDLIPEKGGTFVLSGRFGGETFPSDITYEIAGIHDRDNFGYVVALKKVRV